MSDLGYSSFCDGCGEYTAGGKVCGCPHGIVVCPACGDREPSIYGWKNTNCRCPECDSCGTRVAKEDATEIQIEKHSGIMCPAYLCEECS